VLVLVVLVLVVLSAVDDDDEEEEAFARLTRAEMQRPRVDKLKLLQKR
jgi:hypothetical protein